jgi:hypothetical protein
MSWTTGINGTRGENRCVEERYNSGKRQFYPNKI